MDLSAILMPIITIGGMGLLFGGGLGYAAIKFAVPVDERVDEILTNLPGANCGGCGKAGCEAMAKAMVSGECMANACPVCNENQINAIAKILGVDASSSEKKVAYIRCRGNKEYAKIKFDYEGIETCQDAHLVGGGPKMCSYGCLGYGSCEKVCPFGAIQMKDGLPVINPSACTGCGACAAQCPRQVIDIVPANSTYHVNCVSKDKGKQVKEACTVGCIGCGICTKQCEVDAIKIENNHAVIQYELCVGCGKCEEKCPTKAITHLIKKEQQLIKDDKMMVSVEVAATKDEKKE